MAKRSSRMAPARAYARPPAASGRLASASAPVSGSSRSPIRWKAGPGPSGGFVADLAAEEAEGLDDEVDAGAGLALGGLELVLLKMAGDLDLISLAGEEGLGAGVPEDQVVPAGDGPGGGALVSGQGELHVGPLRDVDLDLLVAVDDRVVDGPGVGALAGGAGLAVLADVADEGAGRGVAHVRVSFAGCRLISYVQSGTGQ